MPKMAFKFYEMDPWLGVAKYCVCAQRVFTKTQKSELTETPVLEWSKAMWTC